MAGLVTLGETLAVLTATRVGPLRYASALALGVAGCESNVAIGVARLGHPSWWVGRVGDDELGRAVLSRLRGEGVDVSRAVVDPGGPTALMIKERRSADLARVVYYRAGSAGSRLAREDVPEDLLASAAVLHTSAITAALGPGPLDALRHAAATARGAGAVVSLDLNYRAALWSPAAAGTTLRRLLPLVDVVFGGEVELEIAAGERDPERAVRAVAEQGPTQVVLTLGAAGAVALIDGTYLTVPAVPVTMIDPVGAGDAFAAGYLAGLLEEASPMERLRRAASVAAVVVATEGDWEGQPDLRELSLGWGAPGDVRR